MGAAHHLDSFGEPCYDYHVTDSCSKPARQPSNVVVLENIIREDTKGSTEVVNAKYDLLERGGYIPTGYKFDPVDTNAK